MENSEVIYFFRQEHYLSQWFYSPFCIDSIEFNCCEQWMMYSKALLFNDIEAAQKILSSRLPGRQKDIGRKVQGFNFDIWKGERENIVFKGNLAKFSQNEELKDKLIDTGSKILAEANPHDLVWGIGLSKEVAEQKYISEWRGKNLLGKVLMKVRSDLNAKPTPITSVDTHKINCS